MPKKVAGYSSSRFNICVKDIKTGEDVIEGWRIVAANVPLNKPSEEAISLAFFLVASEKINDFRSRFADKIFNIKIDFLSTMGNVLDTLLFENYVIPDTESMSVGLMYDAGESLHVTISFVPDGRMK